MTMINFGVVALAIGWTVWYFVHLQKQLLSGAIVVPPVIAGAFVFALCIVLVILTGMSPLHLIWLFPTSFLVGFVLLLFPPVTKGLLLVVGLLMVSAVKRALTRTGRGRSTERARKQSGRSTRTRRRTKASRRRKSR